jgi:hypothetical protein
MYNMAALWLPLACVYTLVHAYARSYIMRVSSEWISLATNYVTTQLCLVIALKEAIFLLPIINGA